MARHKIDVKKYREALARMDRHGAEAIALITANAERADLHPERRKAIKAAAIGETMERLGTEYRELLAMFKRDQELAQAATLPDVTAGNVAERSYWQQHARELVASVPPDAVPAAIERALIKAGPVARSEILRAAAGRVTGASLPTRNEFTQLKNRYETDNERTQRADAAAVDAIGTRLGFLADRIQSYTDDLSALDSATAGGSHVELPSGTVLNLTRQHRPQPVIHPAHFEITANGIEADAERVAEDAWTGRSFTGVTPPPPADAEAPDAA